MPVKVIKNDVIPANARIHLDLREILGRPLGSATSQGNIKMDPSVRWDDVMGSSDTFVKQELVIQRTQHPIRPTPKHMRIDLRGGDVLVAHEFLHGADVLA